MKNSLKSFQKFELSLLDSVAIKGGDTSDLPTEASLIVTEDIMDG